MCARYVELKIQKELQRKDDELAFYAQFGTRREEGVSDAVRASEDARSKLSRQLREAMLPLNQLGVPSKDELPNMSFFGGAGIYSPNRDNVRQYLTKPSGSSQIGGPSLPASVAGEAVLSLLTSATKARTPAYQSYARVKESLRAAQLLSQSSEDQFQTGDVKPAVKDVGRY
jgi:hypothetical protein